MAYTQKGMTQTFGNTTATTVTKLQNNGCTMIPANGPFGNKTIGPRTVIVPADPIEWNETTTYPYLTLVLADNGNSYISKRDVPAGVVVTNETYWIKSSDWNAQLSSIQDIIDSVSVNTAMITTPEEHGAVGDGVTDDSLAIQNAINSGKPFIIGSKTYKGSFSVKGVTLFGGTYMPVSPITLESGAIKGASFVTGGGNHAIDINGESCVVDGCNFSNISGISVNKSKATISNCTFACDTEGFPTEFENEYAIQINSSNGAIVNCIISNISVKGYTNAIYQTGSNQVEGITVSNLITNIVAYGVNTDGLGNTLEFSIVDSIIDQVANTGVVIDNTQNFNITNSFIGTYGITGNVGVQIDSTHEARNIVLDNIIIQSYGEHLASGIKRTGSQSMYLSKFLNIKFVDNLYSLDSFPAIDFNCVFAYCSSISANESAQFFSSGVNNNLFFVGCSSQTGTSTVANGAFNTQGFRLRRESVNLLDKVGEDGMLRFINETARTITIELTSKSTAGGFTYYTYIANNNTLSDPHVVSGTGSRSLTLVIPPNGCFGMTSTDIQNAVETLTYY